MSELISKKRAIFLDRDGTLIEDLHYPRDPEKVRWVPGAVDALKELQGLGFLLFVISNQSGVGRGIITDLQFRKVHERFCDLLKDAGIEIREFAYCFHRPEDDCACRKPRTKFIEELARSHSVDLNQSYTIGDKWSDALMGFRAGASGMILKSESLEPVPPELKAVEVPVFSSWTEIAQFMKRLPRS